jgi:uncharacterized protein YukE
MEQQQAIWSTHHGHAMAQVQVRCYELSDACACLASAQEQHAVLVEGLASGASSGQQACQGDARSALNGWKTQHAQEG